MLSEDEGVKAIQSLLSIVNITEPEAVSRQNWNIFSDEEKIKTEDAYNTFKKNLN